MIPSMCMRNAEGCCMCNAEGCCMIPSMCMHFLCTSVTLVTLRVVA
jgi:hypothetical protein